MSASIHNFVSLPSITYTRIHASNNIHNNANPVVHSETIHGTHVLWAQPHTEPVSNNNHNNNNNNPKRPLHISGLFFVAHGCSHSNTDWFLDCENCIGLPEERAIVEMALDQGLVVIALSSKNRKTKCWKAPTAINKEVQDDDNDDDSDIPPLAAVLQEFLNRFDGRSSSGLSTNNVSLPILAFGASSGGYFVSSIATPLFEKYHITINGFISQIMATQVDERATSCNVYITMNRDTTTDATANALVQPQSRPVVIPTTTTSATTTTRKKQIRLPPLPITPHYFSERIPNLITKEQSEHMVQAMRNAKLLDSDGYLQMNPRHPQHSWRTVLRPMVPFFQDSFIPDQSPISEVLNVAYGLHEMTRDGVKEALEFCTSHR